MYALRAARAGIALFLAPVFASLAFPVSADEGGGPKERREHYLAYREVVRRTAGMVEDPDAARLARARKLHVLNVTWEDVGRFHNSSVGPNISDMTIQVQQIDPDTQQAHLTCMPVIRYPNFSDQTADVSIKKFYVLVGNEKKGETLRALSLAQYLGNFRKYLSKPRSWKGDGTYLLADRDTHVLVSAQACFLPVPKKGIAEFNPVLFNYQSRHGDPAVLAILVTREGTSATVIDNQRDRFQASGGTWGQRLFHNQQGERCSLTGQRLSDFKAETEPKSKPDPESEPKQPMPKAADLAGLQMVMLIQVPLKQKPPPEDTNKDKDKSSKEKDKAKDKDKASARDRGKSDVEEAVIGHGKVEGPYTEIDGLPIERDPRFPIRVTVQFYKATSNGVVSEKDLDDVRKQIDKVYAEGDFVGSLVVGPQAGRPTEYDGDKVEPPDWWDRFWDDYYRRTRLSRAELVQKLREEKADPAWAPLTEVALQAEAEEFARSWVPPRSWWERPPVWGAAGGVVLLVVLGWLFVRNRGSASAQV
jgi:hypothetical protein